MSESKSFLDFAEETANLAESFIGGTIKLTSAQQEVVSAYQAARKAIKEQHRSFDQAEGKAIANIKQAFGQKHEALNAKTRKLKEKFEEECVSLGLRKEDIPLSEYKVVKNADNVAKTVLSKIGDAGRYLKDGLSAK